MQVQPEAVHSPRGCAASWGAMTLMVWSENVVDVVRFFGMLPRDHIVNSKSAEFVTFFFLRRFKFGSSPSFEPRSLCVKLYILGVFLVLHCVM